MKTGRKNIFDMVQELEQRADAMLDYQIPANRMTVDAFCGAEHLELEGYGTFGMQETAHGQLAELVGIPKAYYDRMRDEAERWVRHESGRLREMAE